ncbi:MAG: heat-shock protein HtpX [Candidatus Dormiibacterota bacterium]
MVQKAVPEVLFVCVHNPGRSRLAAGLLYKRADGRVRMRSAGSEPADQLNPRVVEATNEIGIDISQEFSCPIFPGKRYEDWELDDPAGQDLATVRRIRDRWWL